MSSHRFSCILHHGNPDDPSLVTTHHCDHTYCTNPLHLRWGTIQDNRHEWLARGNTHKWRMSVPRGEHNGQSKLTVTQVREIKTLLKQGEIQRLIGLKFGVDQALISRIKHGQAWKVA